MSTLNIKLPFLRNKWQDCILSLYFYSKSTFECISVGLPAFACISLIWLGRDTQLGSTGQKLSRSVLEGNDDHFDEGEDGDEDVNDDLDDDDDDSDTRLN